MKLSEIQNEINFAKKVVFKGEFQDTQSIIEKACKELDPIKFNYVMDIGGKADINNDKLIKQVAKKYNISFSKLKAIFYGVKNK